MPRNKEKGIKKVQQLNGGEQIRNIRQSLLLEQKYFAQLIGTSRSNVSNYEHERVKPSFSVLKKIKKVAEENNIPFDIAVYLKKS